ncbi:MAG: response regulator [Rubrivivax sp.]|nr:response regulator [Rubrivivax sp.]MDP3613183.1 response regulator [Rubrivivax sp.]
MFLVEDSQLTVDNLSALLRQTGLDCIVGSAEDETTALQRIHGLHQEQPLDLLIIDIFLKAGSGLGVLKKLAGLPGGVSLIPRVVITNFAREEIQQACLALGAERFFDKCTNLDALVEHCHTVLARRNSRA